AGLGGVVLAVMLNSGIVTSEELEARFGLPALGSVPLLSSVSDPEDRHLLPSDYLVAKPLSSFAESVRALRTAMMSSRIGERITVVAISSPLPGDGKTTASLCLARSSAMAGLRVVLVDCDLRRRNVNRMLGIEPELGLIDVLNDESCLPQALFLDEASGAHVLPLTKNSFTPKDVFASAAMARLTDRLRSMYDLVIFDTAPVLAVSDTRMLAGLADTTVLLVQWRKTPEKAVTASLRILEHIGAVVGGLALTQVDMKKQARYGYGDAGYYYSEYQKYYTT
ncbi:MAG: CpsD/CapB family tyrosine-protein kinase, partial [Alsobacter sp.]